MSRRRKVVLAVLALVVVATGVAGWLGPRARLGREIAAVEIPDGLTETYGEYADALWIGPKCITSCARVERIYVSDRDERATLDAVAGALRERGYDVTAYPHGCNPRQGAEPAASLGVYHPHGCGSGTRDGTTAHYDIGKRRDGRVVASITIFLQS